MTRSKRVAKKQKTRTSFGAVLSRIVFILTIIYWLLLVADFAWGANPSLSWFFIFGQYGLTLLITALIMLTTIPIACRNVARPLSAIIRLFAPFSTFCLFQALSALVRLLNPGETFLNIFSWICFALIFTIFIFTTIILKKFKQIPEENEQKLFEKRKKFFFTVLIAEFILSFAYICIICTILPREISRFVRFH